MTYALRYDKTIEMIWDSLPEPASQALGDALAQACADPLGRTEPYGEDDGVMRTLVVSELLFAVVYLGHVTRTLHLYQIDYVG
ncbi:hypothetical protein [Kitasatospora kifunensis]|uniref:Uncharacterized protein n=1 Tax=Kitasatospora kifunensis TaxID=58351 RepID=A0A7W7VTH0_KITKI|nr:hypothetical protein [Kitasatospora kifunensis]MBB4922227.1 hypothetical protein [Kitasatospora kifunensis]